MEFIQITKKKILIYTETEKRESELKKIIKNNLEHLKKIQEKLK